MVWYFFQSSSAEKNANQLLSIWWGAKQQIGVYHNTPQIYAFTNYNILVYKQMTLIMLYQVAEKSLEH